VWSGPGSKGGKGMANGRKVRTGEGGSVLLRNGVGEEKGRAQVEGVFQGFRRRWVVREEKGSLFKNPVVPE